MDMHPFNGFDYKLGKHNIEVFDDVYQSIYDAEEKGSIDERLIETLSIVGDLLLVAYPSMFKQYFDMRHDFISSDRESAAWAVTLAPVLDVVLEKLREERD